MGGDTHWPLPRFNYFREKTETECSKGGYRQVGQQQVHPYKTPEPEEGLIHTSGHPADTGRRGIAQERPGLSIQCCFGWGRLWPVIYMDITNSMPKTQQLQTTTTKTQNTCLKGRITHNIRFSYMAGPAGLQNPSLL